MSETVAVHREKAAQYVSALSAFQTADGKGLQAKGAQERAGLKAYCFGAISELTSIPQESFSGEDRNQLARVCQYLSQLAHLYYIGNGSEEKPDIEFDASYQEAADCFDCYKIAAQLGDRKAYAALGKLYHTGCGTPQNETEAVKWFEKSVAAGDPDCLVMLGYCCYNGSGTRKDLGRAYELVKDRAQAGDPLASHLVDLIAAEDPSVVGSDLADVVTVGEPMRVADAVTVGEPMRVADPVTVGDPALRRGAGAASEGETERFTDQGSGPKPRKTGSGKARRKTAPTAEQETVAFDGAQSGLAGQGGYGAQEGYGAQNGYGSQESYGAQNGYGSQESYAGQNGYGPQGGYAGHNGYSAQGGYAGQNGYGPQGGYAGQNGYGPQGGYAGQNGYGPQGGYAGQNGYPSQGGYPPQDGGGVTYGEGYIAPPEQKKSSGGGLKTALLALALVLVAGGIGFGIFTILSRRGAGQEDSVSSGQTTSQGQSQEAQEQSQQAQVKNETDAPQTETAPQPQTQLETQAPATEAPVQTETTPPTEAKQVRHTYELVQTDMTWEQAAADARARGGYLATISSAAEQQVIENIMSGSSVHTVWLGARRLSASSPFTWGDGTALSYTQWGPGEPNNDEGIELYLDMYRLDGVWYWNDVPNDISAYYSGKMGYILEREIEE